MDKTRVKQMVMEHLKKERALAMDSYKSQRQASIDAPGPMESRYDTSKKEAAWVAGQHSKRIWAE